MPKFKISDTICCKDRNQQPPGRYEAEILGFDSMFGVYSLKYKDGSYDKISQGLIDKHWTLPKYADSTIWRLLNENRN